MINKRIYTSLYVDDAEIFTIPVIAAGFVGAIIAFGTGAFLAASLGVLCGWW